MLYGRIAVALRKGRTVHPYYVSIFEHHGGFVSKATLHSWRISTDDAYLLWFDSHGAPAFQFNGPKLWKVVAIAHHHLRPQEDPLDALWFWTGPCIDLPGRDPRLTLLREASEEERRVNHRLLRLMVDERANGYAVY